MTVERGALPEQQGKPYRQRLQGEDRKRMASALAAGYAAGSTIRGLADEWDMAYGTVHALLREAKVELRKQGTRPQPDGSGSGTGAAE